MTRKQSCTFSGMLLFTMLAAGIVCSGQEKKEFPAPKEETAVGAAFAGTWEGTYSSSVVKPTRVVLVFQQRGRP